MRRRCERSRRNEQETPVEKVVKRREGACFAQVVENVEKIKVRI
jgi:hypothetical protein